MKINDAMILLLIYVLKDVISDMILPFYDWNNLFIYFYTITGPILNKKKYSDYWRRSNNNNISIHKMNNYL